MTDIQSILRGEAREMFHLAALPESAGGWTHYYEGMADGLLRAADILARETEPGPFA